MTQVGQTRKERPRQGIWRLWVDPEHVRNSDAGNKPRTPVARRQTITDIKDRDVQN